MKVIEVTLSRVSIDTVTDLAARAVPLARACVKQTQMGGIYYAHEANMLYGIIRAHIVGRPGARYSPELEQLAIEIRDKLREEAACNSVERAHENSTIATTLRPYIFAEVTGIPTKQVKDDVDHRLRRWFVSPEFWRAPRPMTDMDICVAVPAGRRTSVSGEMVKWGGDWVTGLNGAADLVEEFARQCGAPAETYASPAVRKALAYLRPTINRLGGYAKMVRVNPEKTWSLIMPVWREDAALPEMLETKP